MAKCMICGKAEPVMRCICGECLPQREKRGRLPKAELDGMIEANRAYWTDIFSQTEDEQRELLDAMSAARRAMEGKTDRSTIAIGNFLDALLSCSGLATDATNQEIYTILQLLGWEIVED